MLIFQNDNITVDYFSNDNNEEGVVGPHIYITGKDKFSFDKTFKANEEFEVVNMLSVEELREIMHKLIERGFNNGK